MIAATLSRFAATFMMRALRAAAVDAVDTPPDA